MTLSNKYNNKKPLISVVMPAYNAERYIALAIESILDQSFKSFELIIVDDASNDKTYSIAKKYEKLDSRISLVRNKTNLKIAGTLNKGIGLAKSDIIARMDADDFSLKDRLQLQYDYLLKYPRVAIVGGYMVMVDERGVGNSIRKYPDESDKLKKVMFRYSPFAHPTVMYRKHVIQEFGGYALGVFPCEDIDLWFKVGTKYEFGCIDKPLLKYTLYSNSSSHKTLRDIEMLTFKIRINAIRLYNYKPSLWDLIYNIGQFATIWFIPKDLRVRLYNFLRGNNLI